jgi:hypothetical protein
MNGRVAKALRHRVYRDLSKRQVERYRRTKDGSIRLMENSMRKLYQNAKRELRRVVHA